MSSGWALFRHKWLRPEVYPLAGAMTAAVGICGFAIYNKTRDTTVAWNKMRRASDANITAVDEVVPMLTSARGKSTSIFGMDRGIFESQYKYMDAEPKKFTIRVGEPEEEEEEGEEEEEKEEQEEEGGEAAAVDEAQDESESKGEDVALPTEYEEPKKSDNVDAVTREEPKRGKASTIAENAAIKHGSVDAVEGKSEKSSSATGNDETSEKEETDDTDSGIDITSIKGEANEKVQEAVDAALDVLVSNEEKAKAKSETVKDVPSDSNPTA